MNAQWWVINAISRPGGTRGPQLTHYVVVQAATRPVNAVAGPFPTQAAAQAWQTSANSAGNSPGSAIGAATNDLLGGVNIGAWLLRIGEILLGLVLIAVGVAHMTRAVPIATRIAETAGAGALLA
jgi:hypothetical protein